MCVFIPLIVGFICGLLGYLLGKLLGSNGTLKADYENQITINNKLKTDYDAQKLKFKTLETDLERYKTQETSELSQLKDEATHAKSEICNLNDYLKSLQSELDTCKASQSNIQILNQDLQASKLKIVALENENTDLKTKADHHATSLNAQTNGAIGLAASTVASSDNNFADLEAENKRLKLRIVELEQQNTISAFTFDEQAAKLAFGKKITQDDLKIVEGIGPKIEELYHAAGIKTWKQLSTTSVEISQKILNDGGDRFAMHNPGTWADQAKLAYEGQWAELKKWQDELDAGK